MIQAYQKKAKMDSEVIRIFVAIDRVLSFVEDVEKLEDKKHRFLNLIEDSLHIIEDCGQFILKYLRGSLKGAIPIS